jgi:hypothetical protein
LELELYLPVLNGLTPFEVSGMAMYRLFVLFRAHQLLSLAIACQEGRLYFAITTFILHAPAEGIMADI